MSDMQITEAALKELFDRCNGRRSNYLIMHAEPQEYRDLLEKEGWIVFLKNGGKQPWYTASQKLIEKFRELEKHEKAQLAAQAAEEEEERKETNRALAAKSAQEAKKLAETFSKPVKDDLPDIAVGTIFGPNNQQYKNAVEAAKALNVNPTTIRKWCGDDENKSWTRYE